MASTYTTILGSDSLSDGRVKINANYLTIESDIESVQTIADAKVAYSGTTPAVGDLVVAAATDGLSIKKKVFTASQVLESDSNGQPTSAAKGTAYNKNFGNGATDINPGNTTVLLTGDQTVAGIKTFSSSPIAPTVSANDNSTKIATTAYADNAVASASGVTIYPNVPNVGVLATTYFTHSLRVDADLGWTITGTPTNNGNWISLSGATNTRATNTLSGRPSGANANAATLQWNSGIDFKMSYLHTQKTLSTGTTPSGAGDIWYWHGVTTAATATSYVADITDVSRRAGFAHYNGRIYAITADGTTVTATNIQADAATTKRHFMIDFTPTSVKFYINGALVATHTTNIPNDGNDIYANFGGFDGDGGLSGDFGISGDIIFSETLS